MPELRMRATAAAAVTQAKIAGPAMDSEPDVSAFGFGRLASWLDAVSAAVAFSLLRCFGTYGDAIEPGGWEADVEQESEAARGHAVNSSSFEMRDRLQCRKHET